MPLTEKQWTRLARELQRALARVAPDWADPGTHDPGIAVLEVLAYALDDLQHRPKTFDDHGRDLAQRVARGAAALATAGVEDDCGAGLQRVNYMHGMLLGVDDFRAEQDYVRSRLSRRNRMLHGTGIVSGLDVTVEGNAGSRRVAITPGLAFDPRGNEICVDKLFTLALPAQGATLYVQLAYVEHLCQFAPVGAADPLDATAGASTALPTRVAETFRATLASVSISSAVAIARLRKVRGSWRIDPTFKASHVRE